MLSISATDINNIILYLINNPILSVSLFVCWLQILYILYVIVKYLCGYEESYRNILTVILLPLLALRLKVCAKGGNFLYDNIYFCDYSYDPRQTYNEFMESHVLLHSSLIILNLIPFCNLILISLSLLYNLKHFCMHIHETNKNKRIYQNINNVQ